MEIKLRQGKHLFIKILHHRKNVQPSRPSRRHKVPQRELVIDVGKCT